MDCYRCLIQWGINTGGAVRTSTLPIPFTNVFLAVASTSSEWCCPGCSATNTTVTTRAYQSNRPDVAQPNDVNWIIIGCQPQWGTSVSPIIFSISFSNTMYTILQMPQSASTSAFRAEVWALERKDQDSCAFFTGSGNYSRHWIAVGF